MAQRGRSAWASIQLPVCMLIFMALPGSFTSGAGASRPHSVQNDLAMPGNMTALAAQSASSWGLASFLDVAGVVSRHTLLCVPFGRPASLLLIRPRMRNHVCMAQGPAPQRRTLWRGPALTRLLPWWSLSWATQLPSGAGPAMPCTAPAPAACAPESTPTEPDCVGPPALTQPLLVSARQRSPPSLRTRLLLHNGFARRQSCPASGPPARPEATERRAGATWPAGSPTSASSRGPTQGRRRRARPRRWPPRSRRTRSMWAPRSWSAAWAQRSSRSRARLQRIWRSAGQRIALFGVVLACAAAQCTCLVHACT